MTEQGSEATAAPCGSESTEARSCSTAGAASPVALRWKEKPAPAPEPVLGNAFFRGSLKSHPAAPADAVLDGTTYHVFEYRGERILYDLNTTTICLIDPLAFDILWRAGSANRQTVERELSDRYEPEDLAGAFAEIEKLKSRGFFTRPLPPTSEEMNLRFSKLVDHAPRRIQLLVAQSCNLACTYCYAEEQGSNALGKLMSWETAKASVDHLIRTSRRRKSLNINFFGGEPLLNFKLIKRVVEYAVEEGKKHGKVFDFTVSTNGSLLDDEKIEFMVKHQFHYLISIDGDEETHNRQRPARNGRNAYRTIVENAKKLQARYTNRSAVKIRANATALSPSRLKLAEALRKEGFEFVGVGVIEERPAGDNRLAVTAAHRDLEIRDDEVLLDQYLDSIRTGARLAYNPWLKLLRELKTKRDIIGIRCGVCRNTTTVGTAGKLYPCHRYEGMDAYEVGDVRQGMNRARVESYYRMAYDNSYPGCSQCWARVTCGGACTWVLNDDKGGFHPPTDFHCEEIQRKLELTLWLFTKLQREQPERLRQIMKD